MKIRMVLVERDRSSLVFPVNNTKIQYDNEINYIEYATILQLDDVPVNIEFSISAETDMTWMSVRGKEPDNAEHLGYHFYSHVWIRPGLMQLMLFQVKFNFAKACKCT